MSRLRAIAVTNRPGLSGSLLYVTMYYYYPTTNGGMQYGSSVGIYTHRMHVFARLASILYAQSVLSKQNSCIGAQEEAY